MRHRFPTRRPLALAIAPVAALIVTPRAAQAAPPGGVGYGLVFADEFQGTSLDKMKWIDQYPWSRTHNHDAYVAPQNVLVGAGELTLRAERKAQGGKAFTSGAISTGYTKYRFDGGFFEARMLLPSTPGSWPAFWGLDNGWPPEADIMEFPVTTDGGTNGYPTTDYHTAFHYTNSSGGNSAGAGRVNPGSAGDLSLAYHTFGMEWISDTSVAFFFDGAQISSFTNPEVADMTGMYLILNYAVGGWPGTPSLAQWAADHTDEWKVDYVRVWQKRPTGSATTSTWNINGGGAWDTGANWGGIIPSIADQSATFGRVGTAASSTITWANSRTLGAITFDGTAGGTTAYTLGADANAGLQMANAAGATIQALATSTASHAINARVELYNDTVIRNDMTGGQTLALNGGVIGKGKMIVEGPGMVTLSGAGAYEGGTTIDGGGQGPAVLRVNANNALGTGSVTIGEAGNGTTARLEIIGGRTLPNNIDLRGRTNSTVAIQNISGRNIIGGTVAANLGGNIYQIQSDAGTLLLTGTGTGATAPGVAIQAGSGDRNITLQGAGNGEVSGIIRNGGGTISITKAGAGTWTLSGANTYTGPTTIAGGTLKLGSLAGPSPVGAYSFDNVTDTIGTPVSSGTLGTNFVVVNGGTGGTTMNGRAIHTNHPGGSSGATLVAGRFGNALRLDGLGSSIDVLSKIVDQAGTSTWSMSAWIKSSTLGSAFVSKNQGGTGWTSGYSVFYLGSNPIGNVGAIPTAVRWGGGFVQGSTAVADNAWHMVTFVDEGGVKTVYVDGMATTLNVADFNNADTSTTVRLGYNTDTSAGVDGNAHFNGDLDEVKFFNVALTPLQIQRLYTTNVTTAPSTQYLPAATVMNITAAGAGLDLSGNNQTLGSLTGVAGSFVTLGAGNLTAGALNTPTTFAGSINGTGGFTKAGNALMTLSGSNGYTGTTTVNSGILTLSNTGVLNSATLIVNTGATMNINGNINGAPTGGVALTANGSVNFAGNSGVVSRLHTLSSLNVGAGAQMNLLASGSPAAPVVLKTSAMVLGNTASKIDITNNAMVLDYGTGGSPIQIVREWIVAGRNDGAWTGNGITSSQAAIIAANAGDFHKAAIGFGDAGEMGISNFAGQNVLANSVLVRYTYTGDANLDGVVDGTDFTVLALHFNAATQVWSDGDFNFDGQVNALDFNALASNFGSSLPSAPLEGGALGQVVPEPSSAAILILASSLLAKRKRVSR